MVHLFSKTSWPCMFTVTLKMDPLRLIIFAISFCVLGISCIGIDYVLTDEKDYEEPFQNTTNATSDGRKSAKDSKTVIKTNLTVVENEAIDIRTAEFEIESDDKENVDDILRSKKTLRNNLLQSRVSPVINTARNFHFTETTTATSNHRHILDIIDANYEDEIGADESHSIARKNDDESLSMGTIILSPESARNVYKKIYMPDFHNLAPVKLELSNKNVLSDNCPRKISKTWYVPEDYPCWELPLLYGAPDHTGKPKEVFRIHATELKNIRKRDTLKKTLVSGFRHRDWSKKTRDESKWCQIEPCYGDHTLCLFTRSQNSKICDGGYVVKKPTAHEQMAITNTINSMRNRVASGLAESYQHLPKAANMEQMMYERDLETMAAVWLRQCLPGPAPCSSLYREIVTQLECTKYLKHCCLRSREALSGKCKPLRECFVPPIIGCLHTWFESAGQHLRSMDVKCGHIERKTFNTIQMLWAKTIHVGCAYGERPNGDVRVVCNFAPGAPFYLMSQFYCGLIPSKDKGNKYKNLTVDLTTDEFMDSLGLQMLKKRKSHKFKILKQNRTFGLSKHSLIWGVESLFRIYQPGWGGKEANGTVGFVARLVTEYVFLESDLSVCDADEPVYVTGEAGSLCVENGRRYGALCYNFRDPTPGYRLVAVLAPVALFTLILYDLFSGVVRQANY